MNLRFGYGTNGFANHRLEDALAVIADLGYTGVALTLDHAHLDPYGPDLGRRVAELAARLGELRLAVVIETGARYLLDPWHKHAPTLLHDDPAKRLDLLRRAIDVAADLDAEAVSLWSGVRPAGVPEKTAWERLVRGCADVVEYAGARGVTLGMEPEPGMLVETIAQWERLYQSLDGRLGLTLDIGHCRAVEADDVPRCVRLAGPHLVNVQIDDMCRGVHEHLELGAGEIDFPPVLTALSEVGYPGLVTVELPRHSHAAPAVAAQSLAFLRGAQWLARATAQVAADPDRISTLLPAARRNVGSDRADLARVRLLQALPDAASRVRELYHFGDNDEKRAVLLVLPSVDATGTHADLLRDALRSNDTRLVAAALGPYAAHLADAEWRHAILKCVFMGVPLAGLHGIDNRADAELGRLLDGLRAEREAAGRIMPGDAAALLERLR